MKYKTGINLMTTRGGYGTLGDFNQKFQFRIRKNQLDAMGIDAYSH